MGIKVALRRLRRHRSAWGELANRCRVASGSDALETSKTRNAIRALGVELVAEARGGLGVLVGQMTAVAILDCYSRQL